MRNKILMLMLLVLFVPTMAMSDDTALSALGELATTPAASDEFYVNDGGTSKRIQYSNVMSGEAATVTTITGLAPDTQNTYARTQYLIPVASSTTAMGEIAIGDATHVLTSNGAGSAPTFQAAAGGDSISINGSAVVDPDFVSTGEVAFVNTSNTVTADVNWTNIENIVNIPIIKPNDVDNKGSILVWFNDLRASVVTAITARSTEDDATAEIFTVGGSATGSINWDDLHVIEPLVMEDDNTGGVNWYSTRITTGINWAEIELYDTVGINWTSGSPDESIFSIKVRGE